MFMHYSRPVFNNYLKRMGVTEESHHIPENEIEVQVGGGLCMGGHPCSHPKVQPTVWRLT